MSWDTSEALKKYIDTAVLTSKIEILDYIINGEFTTELSYLTDIRNQLVRELQHNATTEEYAPTPDHELDWPEQEEQ